MKRAIFMLALLGATWHLAMAQQALDATGGSVSVSTNLLIDYSVGELATATTGVPGSDNYYTAGVIQPVYWIVNDVMTTFDELYSLKVFPNPVGKSLTIETDYRGFQNFQFSNLLGQQVATGGFGYAPLDLSWMAAGTYFLTLTSTSEHFSKTIKIVKQ